ncbi:unnamed protein product [Cuscuta europaea]|uniref:Uncharacterized protein n=1 Tax=Cuscuta europaea TaxID=41803 RepID=A0A9P1A1D8_CUSEU|nr:unnamed protein product [Cuscuta europaea]
MRSTQLSESLNADFDMFLLIWMLQYVVMLLLFFVNLHCG